MSWSHWDRWGNLIWSLVLNRAEIWGIRFLLVTWIILFSFPLLTFTFTCHDLTLIFVSCTRSPRQHPDSSCWRLFNIPSLSLFSYDGVPFLMHDSTLRRTTNVAEVFPNRTHLDASMFTWAELQQLNAGDWFLSVRLTHARTQKMQYHFITEVWNSNWRLNDRHCYLKTKTWRHLSYILRSVMFFLQYCCSLKHISTFRSVLPFRLMLMFDLFYFIKSGGWEEMSYKIMETDHIWVIFFPIFLLMIFFFKSDFLLFGVDYSAVDLPAFPLSLSALPLNRESMSHFSARVSSLVFVSLMLSVFFFHSLPLFLIINILNIPC